ncbi:MAG: penicillin-binding transpeptidase domain-containing protein [Bryobacteraceae bacterium]
MTRRSFAAIALAELGVRSFAEERPLHWLALNLTGEVRDADWPGVAKPVCLGSLLKPFLALAFLATHRQSPVIECRGTLAGCWHPQGHGRQDIVSALANSCNAYFLQLAATLDRAALDTTCLSYGLASPPRIWAPPRLIGLEEGWPQAPLCAARAFAALARNNHDVHARTVLAGMAQCARSGTGRAVNLACFAKTGTARCSHLRSDCVDGFIAAIYPMDQPRYIILASRHNSSGANAAAVIKPLAGRLLRSVG